MQTPSTVGDKISLQETWLSFVPLSKSANGDLLLEQGARFGGRKAAWVAVAVGLQEAILGRRTHREEKTSVFLTELDMSILLQGFDDAWQEWNEAFGTDPVERLPGQHQCLFDLWPIPTTENCCGY